MSLIFPMSQMFTVVHKHAAVKNVCKANENFITDAKTQLKYCKSRPILSDPRGT